MSRRALLLALGLVLAITASLAFVAGRITSPAQRAAAAAAPTVRPATAQAQLRVVRPAVVGRASVTFDRPTQVDFSSVADGSGVVTYNPLRTGAPLRAGDLLLEVSGQPVIALSAPFSPYRDLHIEDSGRDVVVLKSALRDLGYAMSPGESLSSSDMERIARLTRRRGYALPRVPEERAPGSEGGSPSGVSGQAGGGQDDEPAVEAAPRSPDATAPEDAPAEAAPRGSTPPGSTPEPTPEPTSEPTPEAPRLVPMLPRSWWVGLRLPARIASPGPRVGQHLGTGRPVTVTRAAPAVKLKLPAGTADRVTTGTRLTFEPTGDAEQSWTVVAVRQVVPASAGGSAPDTVLVAVDPAPKARLINALGKVTIGSEDARKVLAVPLTAVVQDSAGEPAVRVRRGEDTELVGVDLGDQAEGWVEVAPDNDALIPGAVVELG